MRALTVVALILVASLALQGCKARKREPMPGPQVRAAVIPNVAGCGFFYASTCYNPRRLGL